VNAAAQHDRGPEVEQLGDGVKGGGEQAEERREERPVLVHRLQERVENERKSHVAERLDEVRPEAQAEEGLRRPDVARRRRGVGKDDELRRHVELAEEAGEHRDQEEDARDPGVGLEPARRGLVPGVRDRVHGHPPLARSGRAGGALVDGHLPR
jgi:hypothetical protein